MAKILALILLAMAASWVFGVRIHPSALGDFWALNHSKWVEVDFKLRSPLVGELISDSSDFIQVKVHGAPVSIPRKEIRGVRRLFFYDLAGYGAEMLGKKALLTCHPGDRPFYFPQSRGAKRPSPAA